MLTESSRLRVTHRHSPAAQRGNVRGGRCNHMGGLHGVAPHNSTCCCNKLWPTSRPSRRSSARCSLPRSTPMRRVARTVSARGRSSSRCPTTASVLAAIAIVCVGDAHRCGGVLMRFGAAVAVEAGGSDCFGVNRRRGARLQLCGSGFAQAIDHPMDDQFDGMPPIGVNPERVAPSRRSIRRTCACPGSPAVRQCLLLHRHEI